MGDAICNNCKHFKAKAGGFGDCILRDSTVYWQEKYCNCFKFKDNWNVTEDKTMAKDFLEEHFVKGAKECSSPEDILNWYRNLYYKENENTERRIIAEAINEFFAKKLPALLKEAKIVATDAVDAYIYANLKNALDTQFLYEDVILPVIEGYKNEVKNDKM